MVKRLGTGVLVDLEKYLHEDLLGHIVVVGLAAQVVAHVSPHHGVENLDEGAVGGLIPGVHPRKETGGNP